MHPVHLLYRFRVIKRSKEWQREKQTERDSERERQKERQRARKLSDHGTI